MNSMHEYVTFRGILRGQGHAAECEVSAIKITRPGAAFIYRQYKVTRVSEQLPDGDYELVANGGTVRLRNVGGNWLSP